MTTLCVQHTVRSYDEWKPVFDDHEKKRREYGATTHRLFRDAANANAIMVLTTFPSRSDAEAFMGDPSLKEAMERGGVTDPAVRIFEDIEDIEY